MKLGQLEANMDYVGLSNVSFDNVIGETTLKRLGGILDLTSEGIRLGFREMADILPIMP